MIPLFKVLMSPSAPESVGKVLSSGYVGEGPVSRAFEQSFSRAVGSEGDVLVVNSGTSALTLAMRLCGVGPNDRVVVSPMTCAATVVPIVNAGAIPVWCDVDPRTGNATPRTVADALDRCDSLARCVVVVDWGGRACDYNGIRQVCGTAPIVQDAAHGLDCLPPAQAGCGDYVAWSFQAIKFLTCGDGGALLTPLGQRRRARLLRWFGLDRRSSESFRCAQDITESGYKFHLNDVSAAIGQANLAPAFSALARQRANARKLHGLIRNGCVEVPPLDPSASYWMFTVLVNDRDGFCEHMGRCGVASSAVHRRCDAHPAFRLSRPLPLPGLDSFASRNVSVPCGWWMGDEEVGIVASAVNCYRE